MTETTAVQAPPAPAPTRRAPSPRIASLDLVRGVMLIASVGVNSLIVTPEWFDHARWESVHPIDVIFPVFVTLSGCGLAFAMHRGVKIAPLARRVVILLAAGLLYNAVVSNTWDIGTWRVTGVLQLYALLVAAVGVLHFVTRTWVGWAVITASLVVAQVVLLSVSASQCVGGVLTRACNPSGAVDTVVLGAYHIYQLGAAGHDPEGLVAALGALISASAGATVGHLILTTRRTSIEKSRGVSGAVLPLLAAAAAFAGLALLAWAAPGWFGGEALPAFKRLWTAPFALSIASATTIALLLGHLLVDRPSRSRVLAVVSYPLLALGRNSLLVYFGSHALMSILQRPIDGGPSLSARISSAIAIGGHPQATWTALLLLFWIGLACLLHRHRIYLRP
jgi:predicted acyltransferase